MDARANARLLLQAQAVLGIEIRAATPQEAYRLVSYDKRSNQRVPPKTEAPPETAVLVEETFKAQQLATLVKTGQSQEAIDAEIARRWKWICDTTMTGSEIPIDRGLVKECEAQLATDGWKLVMVTTHLCYYRRQQTPPAASAVGSASALPAPSAPSQPPPSTANAPEPSILPTEVPAPPVIDASAPTTAA